MKADHYSALGSVRGIAALVVCLSHAALVYPLPETFRKAFDTPMNSHGAVVLFFVLSGFVLGLSWLRFGAGLTSAVMFYVRRGFRIMPTLWIATTLAIILLMLVPPSAGATFSDWFTRFNHTLSPREIVLGYLVMDNEVLPPVWTIYVELAGSIAIPPLVWLLSRSRGVAALSVAALAAMAIPASTLPNLFWPAVYMVDFAFGIVLALYPPNLCRRQALGAAGLGLFLLTVGRPLFFFLQTGAWQDGLYRFTSGGAALVEGAGGFMLIAGLISGKVATRWLEWKPVHLLGEWSYSFYLVHFLVIRLIANSMPAMDPIIGTAILMSGTVALSALLAWLMYTFVELPSIRIGKAVTRSKLAAAAMEA